MKYFTGFMMAWGNFCSLPCPSKRWNQNYQSLMLGFLPLVGLMIGIIWAAAYFALVYFGFPFFVVSFLITLLPFALCGFMHMDGFMDCCDAIMSRRPLEDRQRILKDSNTGAFAVVSMIFFVLGYFCFLSTAVTTGVDFVNMVMIVVMSRAVSGLHVLIAKPMAQSQYAKMKEAASQAVASEPSEDEAASEVSDMEIPDEVSAESPTESETVTRGELAAEGGTEPSVIGAAVETAAVRAAEAKTASVETAEAETAAIDTAGAMTTSAETAACERIAREKTTAKNGIFLLLALLLIITAAAFFCSALPIATLIVCGFTALGCLISIQYAKKNLGGMSGDIAGYGILWGELMGVFALVLC